MREQHVTMIGGLRRALFCAAAASALAFASPAGANYEIGLAAWEKGQYEQAIDIWKRFAVAGDVRSKKILGDVFSGKILEESEIAADPGETIGQDDKEALVWYTLAAHHNFAAYQPPTAEEVNARILANMRLPDIRGRLSDADVKEAEKRVAETFARGSPYDLYRLGEMYQRGDGLAKDNGRALLMFELARIRGVGEASIAFEAVKKLEPPKVAKKALEDAVNWQPPLPTELVGSTPQMKELERLKRELEELRLQDALGAISDIDVQMIQRALRSLGFYTGPIDNTLGASTKAAIKKFQYSLVEDDKVMSESDKKAMELGRLSPRQTVELFKRAAKNGHALSQYVFGIMHARGIGVVQDGAQAVEWLTKSADADQKLAHYALGVIYRDGTTGLNEVAPNKTKAAFHFARAWELGYPDAKKALDDLNFGPPPQEE